MKIYRLETSLIFALGKACKAKRTSNLSHHQKGLVKISFGLD